MNFVRIESVLHSANFLLLVLLCVLYSFFEKSASKLRCIKLVINWSRKVLTCSFDGSNPLKNTLNNRAADDTLASSEIVCQLMIFVLILPK